MTMPTDIQIGQIVELKRRLSQVDFDRFAALSGDDNPIHVDPDFAARTKFGRPVAHGMLLYSAISGLVSTQLPGPGSLPLEQHLKFPTATFVGEEVTLRFAVTGLETANNIVELETQVVRPGGELGLEGAARVWIPANGLENRPEVAASRGDPAPTDEALRNLQLGQQAESQHIFQAPDLDEYMDLSGDKSAYYTSVASPRLVPGALLGGLFSTLLGTRLPGRGTNYLKQSFQFTEAATAGEEIVTRVEITRIRAEKQLVNLSTQCLNPTGRVVCRGEALVLVSDVL